MEAPKTEWEFTGDVASWINQILANNKDLPFSEAKIERRTVGSQKRRDLTILDNNKRIVLTGEVKLPFSPDGGTPYNEAVVQDARKKAKIAKSDYFFTWNVNECVLWESFPIKTETKDRKYKSWSVTNITRAEQLSHPLVEREIKTWLLMLLEDFENILRGKIQIGLKSPDEKFIELLESSLQMPINLTLEELVERYNNKRFKSKLDGWMREEQGWLISDDPGDIADNLERAAKFSCYALINKLVFYEAMLKRYSNRLERIIVPDHIDKGDDLRLHFESYFAIAKDETGDYETVFGMNHHETGNVLPFLSDSAVVHLREFLNQIHQFDFSRLDYEVIGSIFERLIAPEERHKYGQYYTRPEVVDLVNSFCIMDGNEKVMDPGCGGGTFLVRAYARKKELKPAGKHGERLLDLFGIDVSNFATHLTTINLATKDLIDDENYPQIARSDFFDIKPDKTFLRLPNHHKGSKFKTKGMGKIQQREVEIPLLDAVIGNPPYVRQEDIRRSKKKKKIERGTKEYYAKVTSDEWSDLSLSGRSDLHCYFWPHAATFIKEDGYLCLLTSSQWLDVDYGFKLQEWLLKNFRIIAVFESIIEPWFIGARVATAVTILKRETDEDARMENTVRFVQLRKPLNEIFPYDGTTVSSVTVADEFRNEILSLDQNAMNDKYRIRLVRQRNLWEQGVRLGEILGKNKNDDGQDSHVSKGKYFGGKWGVFLRASDLWFEIIDKFGDKFAPLAEILDINRGITSGKDAFFYPIDMSYEALKDYSEPLKFEKRFNVPRNMVENREVCIVKCGEKYKQVNTIEAIYLEDEVHSLMEIDRYVVYPQMCSRKILLVNKKKNELKGTYVLDYILWGEKQGYHKGETCSARVSSNREWYDITGHGRGDAFWPKSQQYRHIIASNPYNLQCNCNLYNVIGPSDIDKAVIAGILNSTIIVFAKHQYGRSVGVEGNLKTEVIDVNMMQIPDFRQADKNHLEYVKRAFNKLKDREPLSFISKRRLKRMTYLQTGREDELEQFPDISELDMEDRWELDDAVLCMMGVLSERERKDILVRLYDYLKEFYENTRQKEEKAIVNKNKSKRRGPAKPMEIAVQILEEIEAINPEFIKKYPDDFFDTNMPFDVYDLPDKGNPEPYKDMFTENAVIFSKGKKSYGAVKMKNFCQVSLVCQLGKEGHRGLLRIPNEEPECKNVLASYEQYIVERNKQFEKLVKERTADEDIQEEIYEALMNLIMR